MLLLLMFLLMICKFILNFFLLLCYYSYFFCIFVCLALSKYLYTILYFHIRHDLIFYSFFLSYKWIVLSFSKTEYSVFLLQYMDLTIKAYLKASIFLDFVQLSLWSHSSLTFYIYYNDICISIDIISSSTSSPHHHYDNSGHHDHHLHHHEQDHYDHDHYHYHYHRHCHHHSNFYMPG